MKNITGVTSFLRREIEKEGGDPLRETLNLVPAKNGRDYYVDSDGQYWRSYLFIGNATCYDKVVKPEDFIRARKHLAVFRGSYPSIRRMNYMRRFRISIILRYVWQR